MPDRRRFASFAAAGAALAAFLTGLAGTVACSPSRAAAKASVTADAPAVAVTKAGRADLTQALTLAAEFRPFQEIDVHAKVAGYLKAIYVDVGDRVKAGQLLGVLEIPELQAELLQDEASVKRSAEEIRRAQADLERTESAHQVAHLASTRLAGVIKERPNLVAQQDLDDAAGHDRIAEAQVSTAKAALASAEQQLEVSKASANRTRTLLDYARITAPFEGVVTHRYADTGAMIQAGTSSQSQAMPIVRLSENRLLRLLIPIPESAVPRLRLGEAVDVRVPALDKTFPGVVARFSDKLDDQTRMMRAEVDVKNPDLVLVPGMYAQATITLDERKNAVTVPVQAIDRGDAKASVMVVDGSRRLERRDVALGIETADRVEIRSGLQDGDMVVVGSRSQLKAGQTVTPTEGR